MKKLLKTLLAAAVIMVSALSVVHAAQETQEHTDLLEAVGIISAEDKYSDGITTRAEFVTYVLRMANSGIKSEARAPEFTDVAKSYWAYEQISTAYALGIIKERMAGRFDPDSPIEAPDAARMLLCAIGYTDYVRNMSDANVMRLADSVKLFTNASKAERVPLTRDDVFEMLYNALSADMPYFNGIKGDGTPQYNLKKGVTVLSERFGVYYTEGVVTADDNAAIIGDIAREGGIVIDGEAYDSALEDASQYLGQNVGCYWRDCSPRRELVTVWARKNTTCEIAFADAEYTGSAFNEAKDTKRTVRRINAKSTVLINGSVVRDSQQINDSLTNYDGVVKMIDNDRDGVYDVIIIDRYVNIRVCSYDDVDKVLTGSNGERFELKKYDDIVVKDSYLDRSDLSAVTVDSVVSVYMPLSTDRRVRIVLGAASFVSELVEVDASDERHITILCDDDMSYSVSKFCLFDISELIVGEDYTYYPDWRGQIACVKLGTQSLKLGYIKRVSLTEGEDGVTVTLFTSDGASRNFDVKDMMVLRAADGTTSRIDDTELFTKLVIGGETQRQPIMYKLTKDDKISKIWLAATDSSLMFHILEDDVNKNSYSFEYRNGNFMGKYICTSQTTYMVVPKNGNAEEDYKIASSGIFTNGAYVYFNNDRTSVKMIAIEPDAFLTDLMVYAIDYSVGKTIKAVTPPAILIKKTQTVDEDNEKIWRITVVGNDGNEKSYNLYNTDKVCDMNGRELNYGDVIRIAEDERGRVTTNTIETMYDCREDTHIKYLGSTTVRYLSEVRVIPAEVLARENSYIKFKTYAGFAPGGNGYKASTEVAQIGSARVFVYDKEQNELVQSSPARITAGDKFVLYTSYGVGQMIVYYK